MQDLLWPGLAVAFFLFSGWFVVFSDRLMPAERRDRPDETHDEHADRTEARS